MLMQQTWRAAGEGRYAVTRECECGQRATVRCGAAQGERRPDLNDADKQFARIGWPSAQACGRCSNKFPKRAANS